MGICSSPRPAAVLSSSGMGRSGTSARLFAPASAGKGSSEPPPRGWNSATHPQLRPATLALAAASRAPTATREESSFAG
eukprot:6022213-Alexandrium_andersonii.AAC.1